MSNNLQEPPIVRPSVPSVPRDAPRMRLFRQEEFVARWPEIRPLVDPATPYNAGEYETDDLLTLVKQGRAFALGFLRHDRCEFVMILQTVYMPRKKILFILCWGGSGMRDYLRMFYSDFLSLAKRNGYHAVRGAMRPSMERYAKRMLPNLNNLYSTLETSL